MRGRSDFSHTRPVTLLDFNIRVIALLACLATRFQFTREVSPLQVLDFAGLQRRAGTETWWPLLFSSLAPPSHVSGRPPAQRPILERNLIIVNYPKAHFSSCLIAYDRTM